MELATTHGNISTTLPGVTWTVSSSRRGVAFDLGSGGPTLSASTVLGSITLKPSPDNTGN